ncbi:MAG: baeRF10 domain-containing protein [Microthrixaceae bacterium]
MAVLTEAAVRELAGIRGEAAPITSCYLDVDGRRLVRHQDLEHELDGMLRQARLRANGHASVHDDLRRIEAFVRGGLDRSATRGLAIFACAASDLWEVIELPVPVRSRVVINHAPAVGQLESMVQEREPIGVLLADRQRARLFVFELGRLVERTEMIDELPRDYDARGMRERGTPEHHVEELAHQHLRNAARAAFDLWQVRGFHHLAIGAPDAIARELESALHPYLRERLCGRVHVSVAATHDEVRRAAEETEAVVDRDREAALVGRLKEAAATGRRGVVGLAPTLTALNEHRVERLVVSKGFSQPGWRCSKTGWLASVGPTNPANGHRMTRVDDVVEDAIEEALTQGVPVAICVGNADLDVLGRIGALLRY